MCMGDTHHLAGISACRRKYRLLGSLSGIGKRTRLFGRFPFKTFSRGIAVGMVVYDLCECEIYDLVCLSGCGGSFVCCGGFVFIAAVEEDEIVK